MTAPETSEAEGRDLSDVFRRRTEFRRRAFAFAGICILAFLLWRGWRLFSDFEGPVAAVGPLPPDQPTHRLVEGAVFLAVATLPLLVYFLMRIRIHLRKRRKRAESGQEWIGR